MKTQHFDALRKRLAQLDSLDRKADQDDAKVRTAAATRLDTVLADISKARDSAMIDPQAEERYMALTREAGVLRRVLKE